MPHLEAMLLLRSEAPAAWTAARLADRLYVSETEAAGLLQALKGAGIASRREDGQFIYCAAGDLAALLDRVATSYAADLVDVTELIHSRGDRQGATSAGAFRISKAEDER